MTDESERDSRGRARISPECFERIERETLAAIRSSMSVFAHEVGNRLNNLSLQVQMLDRDFRKESHPLQARSQKMRTELGALCEILDEFAALGRREDLEASVVDLGEVAREVCEVELALAADGRVRAVFPATLDLAPVRAHRDDILRIVLHLCRNGLEAMPDGGTLTLDIAREDTDVTLSVEDTGPGISPDVDAFRPFQTDRRHHLGLRLPFVRHAVKALGGSVRYRSELGRGTQVIVNLPVCHEEQRS